MGASRWGGLGNGNGTAPGGALGAKTPKPGSGVRSRPIAYVCALSNSTQVVIAKGRGAPGASPSESATDICTNASRYLSATAEFIVVTLPCWPQWKAGCWQTRATRLEVSQGHQTLVAFHMLGSAGHGRRSRGGRGGNCPPSRGHGGANGMKCPPTFLGTW